MLYFLSSKLVTFFLEQQQFISRELTLLLITSHLEIDYNVVNGDYFIYLLT